MSLKPEADGVDDGDHQWLVVILHRCNVTEFWSRLEEVT